MTAATERVPPRPTSDSAHGPRAPLRPLTPADALHARHVVHAVAQRIADAPRHGMFGDETVLAFDVLTHALEFAETPEALVVWRAALHDAELRQAGRDAVRALLEHLLRAREAGDLNAARDICDCLPAVLAPDAFGGAALGPHDAPHDVPRDSG